MPVVQFPEHPCQVCHKREATRLCDKILGEFTFAGHPPKGSGLPLHNIMTCDRPICDKCAVNIGGMDLCPKCLNEIKKF